MIPNPLGPKRAIWPRARLLARRTPGLFTEGGTSYSEEQMGLPVERRKPFDSWEANTRRAVLAIEAGKQGRPTSGIFREGGMAYGEEDVWGNKPRSEWRPLTLMEQSRREAEWKAQAEIAALQKPKPQQRKKPEGLLTGLRPFSGNYPTNRRSFSAEF